MNIREKKKIDLRQIKNKCLRLLAKRDHSVTELYQKLKNYNEFSSEDFAAAVEWLKEMGYLVNENLLALKYVKKYRAEGRGRLWISGKLKTKGLKPPVSQTDSEEELVAAKILLEKKLKNQKLTDLDFHDQQRLMRQMTSRGFSPSLVRDLIRLEKK